MGVVGALGSMPVAAAGAPPTIDIWYGNVQAVGEYGRSQEWANVLGRVSDVDDTVTSLTYTLNGGPARPLTIGQDNHPRLVRFGDFNVEIDRDDLVPGNNSVVIRATDQAGNQSQRTVTLVNTPSVTWPLPTSVDWAGVTNPSDVVDVVDGRWSASSSGARTVDTGYDRLFAVGDETWTDYQVEVPVTIHDMDTNIGGVGLFMRWTGHTEEPPHQAGMQPRVGWTPSGSLAWYRARFGHVPRVELATDEEDVLAADTSGFSLAAGSTYIFRARVQRTAAGDDYRLTVFPAGQPPSAGVTVTALDTAFRKDAGSVLFIAHRADVTFGDVTVTNVGGPPPPPTTTTTTVPSTTTTAPSTTTTTTPPPPPGGGLVSDEFSSSSLGSQWSWFDPVGDASRAATGSHATVSVPQGVSHDLWTGRLLAPRLLQSNNDRDFRVEVKIDSAVTAAYEMQGLVAQQDADDLVRAEVHHDGGSRRLFLATINGGEADALTNVAAPSTGPYWLRLARVGDEWTFESSSNGVSWTTVETFTRDMTVNQVGVFAGNFTPAPQHTATFDYFRVN